MADKNKEGGVSFGSQFEGEGPWQQEQKTASALSGIRTQMGNQWVSAHFVFFFSVRRVILPTTGGSLSISLAQTRTSSKMWPQACFWESLDGLKTGTNNQLLTVPGFT